MTEGFSLRVPSAADLRELADRVPTILETAELATRELAEALELADVHAVIAAQRRLLAVGLLAGESARRLEGRC